MYQITKKEAFYMRDNNYGNFVLKSHSRHPKYYLIEETEDVYNRYGKFIRLSAMNALEEYRKSRIVYSSDCEKYKK